jgi:ribonucleotide monophosphatase NagD (HAD superfamily)
MRGILVRTGKFRAEAVRDSAITPDFIIDSIAQIWQVIDADISHSG